MRLVPLGIQPAPAPFAPKTLSAEEFDRSKKIVAWTIDKDGNWYVSRARPHLVGRLIVRDHLFSAPPSIDPSLFVDLLLFSSGLKPFDRQRMAGAVLAPAHDHDAFLRILAELMSAAAERLLRGGLTKIYQERTERTMAVRGRIRWSSSFCRPPQEGLVCDYFQMEMDNELNQLVLAGLEAASRFAPNSQLSSLIFAWRSICKRRAVTAAQFDRAQRSITRRTEMYRPALILSKVLLFGASIEDAFTIGNIDFPEMYFDIAQLFERAVARLLKEYFSGTDIDVLSQERDEQAICRPDRKVYQAIKPDLRIVQGRQILAVFDSKFKSRYVHGERVSEPDLYQAFLYASRSTPLQNPLVCSGILAPRLEMLPLSPPTERHIIVPREDSDIHIKVIPIEIEAAIKAVRDGKSARLAIAESPEWHQVCLSIEAAATRCKFPQTAL